jgi:hypothetical protein
MRCFEDFKDDRICDLCGSKRRCKGGTKFNRSCLKTVECWAVMFPNDYREYYPLEETARVIAVQNRCNYVKLTGEYEI